jgi:hypothetical protein
MYNEFIGYCANMRKILPILLIALGTLLQASPVPLRALELAPAGLIQVPIPVGNAPVFPVTQADLDRDGRSEIISLSAGRLSIFSAGATIWQSPPAWQIVQAAITDLDRNGYPEVTLLLWRPFRPWPVDQWLPNGGRIADFHDATGQSCHLILIGWSGGGYDELWAGSAMADPIKSFATADLNGDNTQELVALEGRYTDPRPPKDLGRSAPIHILKVWEWNGFGFTVVSSMDGTFSKMTLVRGKTGHILILVP